jgi:RNA polymerase-binding transcription factor DksA
MMSPEELASYKSRILALRSRLRGEVAQMADGALETPLTENNGDLSSAADFGTDNFQREFTLGLVEGKDATLEQIEEALERIATGTFGICDVCQTKIPRARLDAIPYAGHCVECAAKLEREFPTD